MRRTLFIVGIIVSTAAPLAAQTYDVQVQDLVLTHVAFDVEISAEGDSLGADGLVVVVGDSETPVTQADDGALLAEDVVVTESGSTDVTLRRGARIVATASTRSIPGWLSLLPPFLAILVALVFKRVIPSLFLGIWVGAMLAIGISFRGAWSGVLDSFQVYVLGALTDPDHAAIILFSFMIGGMVGIISKNGGMQGVVNRIITWASSPERGQIAAGILGVAIFFDDYANSLVVGNTMRPVTDKLRISREKLAYIVDSTAAPVSCIALVTTWIGFEVGLIGTALESLTDIKVSAYGMFLSSIPYSFYPLFAIFFVFAVASMRRDFGPMYKAELRAHRTGQVLRPGAQVDEAAASGKELAPKEGKPHRMINAILPVLVLIGGVLGGLYVTGTQGDASTIREIMHDADSYTALMWASLLSVLTAGVLSVGQRILTMGEVVESWYSGLKGMLFAMIILVLAWSLSDITEVLYTAEYLVTVLGDTLNPGIVPAIVFVLAAATAFATGSSWGSMGILLPLVLPLTWAVLHANDMTEVESYHIMYSAIASILAGSVWGDHCSPISDTTILSSMASGCDHIDHVRTQLPYALVVGSVAVVIGTIPTGFGAPWWLSLIAGLVVLTMILKFFGKSVESAPETVPADN